MPAGTILVPANYPDLRYRLGITTDDLPDAQLESIGILQIAEQQIKDLVTDWASLTGANALYLKAAVLSFAAALAILPIEMNRAQSFHSNSYSESETKVKWGELRAELMGEARSFLLRITTHLITARQPLMVLAGATSSGANWPATIDRWIARAEPMLYTWLDSPRTMRYGWESLP